MSHDKQEIILGSRVSGGVIEVDSDRVTGEGGPERPQLVIPITVRMHQRPEGQRQIALVGLRAWLTSDQQGPPNVPLAAVVTERYYSNMPFTSQSYEQPHGMQATLRFRLNPAELSDLELRRHTGPTHPNLQIYVGLEPEVVGLHSIGEDVERPWGEVGLASFWAHLWNVSVRPLSLNISQQTWIERVLPGLGYDRLRLIEVRLPPGLPDHASAAQEFDRALRALDQGRYAECVVACREIIQMWNAELQASKANHMGDVLGHARGWDDNDHRRTLITTVWTALINVTNVAHHVAGQPSAPEFSAEDARLICYLTAAMSERLSRH